MFSSPEAALRFAFRMREKPIISSPSGVFTSKEKNKNPNAAKLTAYDFHAQAGMIFGRIDRMKEASQVWIYLNYGNKNERAACAKVMSVSLVNNPDAVKYGLTTNDIRNILLSTSVRHCAKETGLTNYKSYKMRGSLHSSMERVMLDTLDELWTWLESGQSKD